MEKCQRSWCAIPNSEKSESGKIGAEIPPQTPRISLRFKFKNFKNFRPDFLGKRFGFRPLKPVSFEKN